jgi:single-strand DNA-binding protein
MKVVVEVMQLIGGRDGGGGGGGVPDSTAEYADQQVSAQPVRRAPSQPPRPPADPDLDAQPDDIPF